MINAELNVGCSIVCCGLKTDSTAQEDYSGRLCEACLGPLDCGARARCAQPRTLRGCASSSIEFCEGSSAF